MSADLKHLPIELKVKSDKTTKGYKRFTVDKKDDGTILNMHIYLPKESPDEITVRIS
jgi:hypothetical protein